MIVLSGSRQLPEDSVEAVASSPLPLIVRSSEMLLDPTIEPKSTRAAIDCPREKIPTADTSRPVEKNIHFNTPPDGRRSILAKASAPPASDGVRPAALHPPQLILGVIVTRMSQRVEFSERARVLQRVTGARHIHANCVICRRHIMIIKFLLRCVSLEIVSNLLRYGGARTAVLLGKRQGSDRPPRGVYLAEIRAGWAIRNFVGESGSNIGTPFRGITILASGGSSRTWV